MQSKRTRPTKADSDDDSDPDDEADTTRGKTKSLPAPTRKPPKSEPDDSENDSESETSDFFESRYKSPPRGQAAVVHVSGNAKKWGASYISTKKIGSSSQNTQDLIPTTVELCEPNTILFLYHERGFYFYNVIEQQSSYARVELITSNGDTAPVKKDQQSRL